MNLFTQTIGDGPPLIIIHGLFGSSDNWMTHARVFASGHRVTVIDLRNHGRSPHADGLFDFDVMASDVFDTLAAEGIRGVTILGHSLGGKVALRFAQLNEFLVDKLIIADIGVRQYKPHHQHIFDTLLPIDLSGFTSRGQVEELVSAGVGDPVTTQFIMKSLYWKEQGKLAWRFNVRALAANIANMTAAIPNSPQIQVPSLFIRGEKSDYIRSEDWPEIQSLVPDAELVTIPAAGHWVHADSPALFQQTVLDFIQN
jgi:pimeloyl-ACP methyl ester carboxylesterase